jgi:hypothetical protein
MRTLRKVAANVVIIAFLMIIVIDGIPSLGALHGHAKMWIDPIVDIVGIWQGSWTVFALIVDNQNGHFQAKIEYANGETAEWSSPRWNQLTKWEQMCRFREMEYTEQLSLDARQSHRPELARYLAELYRPAPGVATKNVTITYHYFTIWPPRPGDHQPLTYPGHWFVKPLFEGAVP